MVDQYYFKRFNLFKLPYQVLLTYHSPIGNTIKLWASYHMLNHILAIRNDLHILNLTTTIIQIRKALNPVFNRIQSRGSLLIYAQSFKAFKFNHEAVFTFVTSWLPGLISNYKQMITSLANNRVVMSIMGRTYIKRPQLDALSASNLNNVLPITPMIFPDRLPKYAPIPTISLSVLDSYTWLNECHALRIPSIQICDTTSSFHLITYPIISNQRSLPFTSLIINLFSEICHFTIIYEHLYFTYYYKYLRINYRLKKSLKHYKTIIKNGRRKKKLVYLGWHTYRHKFGNYRISDLQSSKIEHQYTIKFLTRAYRDYRLQYLKHAKRILNKHTYILNKNTFTYTIKDFFKISSIPKAKTIYTNTFNIISKSLLSFYNLLRQIILCFQSLKTSHYRAFKYFSRELYHLFGLYLRFSKRIFNARKKNLLYSLKIPINNLIKLQFNKGDINPLLVLKLANHVSTLTTFTTLTRRKRIDTKKFVKDLLAFAEKNNKYIPKRRYQRKQYNKKKNNRYIPIYLAYKPKSTNDVLYPFI